MNKSVSEISTWVCECKQIGRWTFDPYFKVKYKCDSNFYWIWLNCVICLKNMQDDTFAHAHNDYLLQFWTNPTKHQVYTILTNCQITYRYGRKYVYRFIIAFELDFRWNNISDGKLEILSASIVFHMNANGGRIYWFDEFLNLIFVLFNMDRVF
jgi:hypothetical protein